LVAGVLQHGFGNWGPMFEVGCWILTVFSSACRCSCTSL
jgi:hypothetical protein